jgi:ABC-type nitrate/sulfonate/bicarbonate transport system permease component
LGTCTHVLCAQALHPYTEVNARVVGRVGQSCAGVALLLAAWELAGQTSALGPSFPPLTKVIQALANPTNTALFQRALSATLGEASLGYAIGMAIAIVSAVVCVIVPRLYGTIYRLSAILSAIPVVALAGLLVSVLPREACPVAVSILAVYFTAFVAVLAGLEGAQQVHHDVLSVLGASRWSRFVRLQAPAAVPALIDGLKLGAPAAMLGAIIGEWFGAERGLGPLLVSSMQNYRIDILWSAALLGAAISLGAYFALAAIERSATAEFR